MLSLILPTFNEAENLEQLLPRIAEALAGAPHEIIVVDDDSPDRTWEVAERLSLHMKNIRVLRRRGRRGLSSAVVEGFGIAQGDVMVVMDCDGQHDPRVLPELARAIHAGAHIAVASRYAAGGSTGGWGGPRLLLSRVATFLASHAPQVRVSDPMSGYFAVRRTAYLPIAHQLRPQGFKILLEILAALPRGTRVTEVPMTFGRRMTGSSKLSLRVQLQFLRQLLRILAARMREFLWEVQWVVLFLLFVVAAVPFAVRAWHLRFLTIDSAVRLRTQSALQRVASERGWLLSDLDVDSVTPFSARVIHREHLRGKDPVECFILRFQPLTLIPCAD